MMAKQTLRPRRYKAVQTTFGAHSLYVFTAPASELWGLLQINRRTEDKNEGYQRALSSGRVAAIARFIEAGNTIPTAVIASLDAGASFDENSSELLVPDGSNVGWVIDGQHRLAGAHEAANNGINVNIPVVAFIGLSQDEQINQFITINREARGVPTSLYLDLLGSLRNKKPQDEARERASDIAVQLRRDENSAIYDRIVVTRPPKAGELSLNNFVRKVAPLIIRDRGFLSNYFELEQRRIIDNYFKGMRNVYDDEFRRSDPIFFRTIGFGAMLNTLPLFFSTCLAQYKGFSVDDTTRAFKQIGELPFDNWREMGSGNAAEIQAGEDVRAAIEIAFKRDNERSGGVLRL
jgi:DGQHR domain-containing protein